MWWYPDSSTELCKFLYFLRLIIRLGSSQTIEFQVVNKTSGRKVSDVGKVVKTVPGGDAYLTMPFGNSKLTLARDKNSKYQTMHQITEPEDNGVASALIIDFPIDNIDTMQMAMAKMKDSLLDLGAFGL